MTYFKVTGYHGSELVHLLQNDGSIYWLENGGEIFKLSRVLGHSEMQTTQIYLRDYQSREAQVDHAQFSPVERHHLGKLKRGNGRTV